MKPIYDRAKAELASPLMRMLTGRKKKRWLGLLIILIAGIAGGSYALISNKAEPQAQPPTEQQPAVPANPEEQLPDYIAYIVADTKQEDTASPAQLVIRFRSETGEFLLNAVNCSCSWMIRV